MNLREAHDIAGSLGFPSKMPGTSYGLPASKCITGAKLAAVPGSVCHGCYALKGNYLFPNAQRGLERRLASITHPDWVAAMVTILRHAHSAPGAAKTREGANISVGWHRWHDSGDLQSIEHLDRICQIARQLPAVKFWLPTRELAMVKAYRAHNPIPANLTIRVSATMVDGRAGVWPQTSTVHDKSAPIGHVCPAPRQRNACGDCRACWSKEVLNVSYHKH